MVKTIRNLFNHQNNTLLGAASVLAAAILVSRLVGLLRDRLLASTLGASDALDIYYGAFRLPDLVFNILIAGAVSTAFIPIFAELFHQNEEKSWRYSANMVNFVLAAAVVVCAALIIFAPQILRLIVPGFGPEKFALTVKLSRIMFLSPILLGLSSFFSGILHYFNRFFIYSLAPVLYNVGIIVGVTVFYPVWGLVGLAFGVVLGALLHLLIQIPAAVLCGWRWQPILQFKDQVLWQTLKLMLPRTISAVSIQVNLWVITALASLLATGSIAVFNLADNLQALPIGVFGVSLAVVMFPGLAKAEADQDKERFFKQFSEGFRLIFFITFPLSALFFILRAHIVRVVLGSGEFGWLDTRLTAAVLGLFALSIWAQSLVPLLARAFFSLKDTKTPTFLSVIFITINIILAILFISVIGPDTWLAWFLKVNDLSDVRILALPLSYSLAVLAQTLILFWLFWRKIRFDCKIITSSIFKVIGATLLAMPAAYLVRYGMAQFLPTTTFAGIFVQGLVAGLVGLALYLFIAILFRASEVITLRDLVEKKFKIRLPQVGWEEGEKL